MEKRKFWASLFMLVIVVGLLAYLTFIPVPAANRDLITTILAVLLGAGSAAIPNLFGDADAEKAKLRERIAILESHQKSLEAKYAEVKLSYDTIVNMLVQRHVVEADGITVGGAHAVD